MNEDTPTATFDQKTAKRFWKKVEKTETCWTWTGGGDQFGYGHFWYKEGNWKAHRVSYDAHFGPIPDDQMVDHICRNKSCVNPSHLRLATRKQNSENQGVHRDNRSGARGVSQHSGTGRWQARVRHNGVLYHLGTFGTVDEAAEVARQARLRLYTHNTLDLEAA